MKRAVLLVIVLVGTSASLISCGSTKPKYPPSGLYQRVLASQGVSSAQNAGSLIIIDGRYDIAAPVGRLGAGNSPGLMAISPTRNIIAAFDASPTGNTAYLVDTVRESGISSVRLSGLTQSMVLPTSSPLGYAAVPSATIVGFPFVGAVEVMNFATGSVRTTIAVPNAQTVVADATGTRLLVFSNDSDTVTVLFPAVAAPPVDTSCLSGTPNTVCTIIPGFSRPVFAVVKGSTAYILNCGAQCGGVTSTGQPAPASVAIFDLDSLTITNTIPVDAANMALLSGPTLFVAGTSPSNNACTGVQTAAPTCGRLDVVDLNAMAVTATYVVTDGFHQRMDFGSNGQFFLGSRNCTNIGNVNNPSGEVRGCLSILNTKTNTVVFPPDNGDVTGLQGFLSRSVEYVAEGGNLRVYDTNHDFLLINYFIPEGTIPIVGYVGDVKALDVF